jgi:hypothetical protein
MERTHLGKVKGAEPERFVFITLGEGPCLIKRTSFLTELELREFFQENGRPSLTQGEIDSMIEDARKHLV